jgi:thiol-disulfide isomerase/thioredoxin
MTTKTLIYSTLLFILLSMFACETHQKNTTYLKGTVIERNSQTIILKKSTQDVRNSGLEIQIDENGNFNYEMQPEFTEVYELIFKDELESGIWSPIKFLPENDTIQFTLYPMEKFEENRVVGSSFYEKETVFNEIIQSKYYDKYNILNQKQDSLYKIGEMESDAYKSISDSINAFIADVSNFKLSYLKNQMNLFGYEKYLEILLEESSRPFYNLDTLKMYASQLRQNIPNHPYNQIAQLRLDALSNFKIGGKYVDFSAKDSLGEIYTLSKFISRNEFTLTDLWAPWCGPCIKKSKSILPVYDDLKNSNFEILAVIGGVKSKTEYIEAIKKHKYPWIQLADINEENNIWEKYNISNQGGAQILVDKTGTILAINPELSELKQIILKI